MLSGATRFTNRRLQGPLGYHLAHPVIRSIGSSFSDTPADSSDLLARLWLVHPSEPVVTRSVTQLAFRLDRGRHHTTGEPPLTTHGGNGRAGGIGYHVPRIGLSHGHEIL